MALVRLPALSAQAGDLPIAAYAALCREKPSGDWALDRSDVCLIRQGGLVASAVVRRGLWALTLLTTAGLLAQQGTPAGARALGRCVPRSTDVQASDPLGELWLSAGGSDLFGCLWGAKTYTVWSAGEGGVQLAQFVTMRGTYAAFNGGGGSSSDSSSSLGVMDLKTGKERGLAVAVGPGSYDTGRVTSLVLKANGSIAWISQTSGVANPSTPQLIPTLTEVYADDSSGRRMIASSTAISPTSLALAGSAIYWLQGGVAESATLR